MPSIVRDNLQPRQGFFRTHYFAVLLGGLLLYFVLFLYSFPMVGSQAATLGYVFIALVSWFYGLKKGLLAAVLCLVATSILFRIVLQSHNPIVSQAVVGSLIFFAVALLVGIISNLYVKLKATESQLRAEHEKSEMILGNIFPRKIVERLKKGEVLIADKYLETTILFSDIVGFSDLTKTMRPHDLVLLLDKLITGFDNLSEQYHIEKIKTIGDAYLVVSGLPDENSNHAPDISRMALEMLKFIQEFNRSENLNLQIRIGIHSGSVIGGVIGPKKFTFDLWGDTVNLASRLESTGIPGKIQVSQTTYDLIKDLFTFEPREPLDVKGHGKVQTYFLIGE